MNMITDGTESNWLHGGRLLANSTTGDNSVVTTLSFDESFIVIGMAKAKINIYDSNTGQFRRSLKGHDLGVWASVLVSPVPRARDGASDLMPVDGAPRFKRLQTSTSSRSSQTSGTRRASSFNGVTQSAGPSSSQSYQSFFGATSPGGFGSSHEGRSSGNDPCNSARGWIGLNRPIVVSGGCDREVKVWDATTG